MVKDFEFPYFIQCKIYYWCNLYCLYNTW